jgi:hypothetical protein
MLTFHFQLVTMFKDTPLARCEDQWGAFDVIKQYLGNSVKDPKDNDDAATAAMDSEED